MKIMKLILICLIFPIVFGCSTNNNPKSDYKTIKLEEFVIYGDEPLKHTLYRGSDFDFHYFRWANGKISGKWKIEKNKISFKKELKFGEGELLLHKNKNGEIKLLNY